jgi:hypothetical protein
MLESVRGLLINPTPSLLLRDKIVETKVSMTTSGQQAAILSAQASMKTDVKTGLNKGLSASISKSSNGPTTVRVGVKFEV